MLLRGLARRPLLRVGCFSTETISEKAIPKSIKSFSIMARFRSFASGALFASAVGMYVITFQLQSLLDEVKSAVHDVAARQQVIDDRVNTLHDQLSRINESQE